MRTWPGGRRLPDPRAPRRWSGVRPRRPVLSFIRHRPPVEAAVRPDRGGDRRVRSSWRWTGSDHLLDPRRHDALGPLVALYPGTVRWLWTSAEGELTLVFHARANGPGAPDPPARPGRWGRLRLAGRRGPQPPGLEARASVRRAARDAGPPPCGACRPASATAVVPTSSCIRVRSICTLSMVSRVGAKPGRDPGQLGEVAAPLLDADRLVAAPVDRRGRRGGGTEQARAPWR